MQEIDQSIAEKVAKAGLSDKEAAVYGALLTSGGAFPSKIAGMTRLNRTTVYKILDTLAIRGLVTELEKRGKLFYQVEHPRNIVRYARTRITMANRQLEQAEQIMPVLEGLYSHIINKPIVRFFEGSDGVLQVYEDHVASDEPYEMLGVSNVTDLMQFLPEEFRKRYVSRKEKIGITTRGIFPDKEGDIQYNETIYHNIAKPFLPILRHVPKEFFPYKGEITIYGKNKISLINFSGPQFAGTIIEDQLIHDMMVMIFELAWKGVGSGDLTEERVESKLA